MILISEYIRKVANELFWKQKIQDKFGIECAQKENKPLDPILLRQTYLILDTMPEKLVRQCGVYKLIFSSTMGPNLPYYPTHGYYVHNLVTLNDNIFYHPDVMDDFFDEHGYFIDRPTQTIIHEFAHGYDAARGEISTKPEWTKLSGWSKEPKQGLKRIVIKTPGQETVYGEWYYNPKAGFTRFYAKRNPWDDWAEAFSFYVGNMKSKLPENKIEYFDALLKKYY